MKQKKQKGGLGAVKIGAAVVLAAVLGQAQPTGSLYVRAEEAGTVAVDYNQLRELLKQGNISLKKTLGDRQDQLDAYQEIWDILKREQGNMEDRAEELEETDHDLTEEEREEAQLYSSNASMLRSSASRIYSQLENMTSEKTERSVEKTIDAYVAAAQALMNSYCQMAQNVESGEARVEAARASYEAALRRQSAGSAVQEETDQAKEKMDQAEQSLSSLKLQTASLRSQLLTMLGISDNDQTVIGSIPEPDLAAIDAVDYETDRVKAMGNDTDVLSARHSQADTPGEKTVRASLVREAEGGKEADFLAVYEGLLAARSEYQAAMAAYESASMSYQGLLRKQQAGMLTNTQYLEGEADFQEAESLKETAAMKLTAAYEAYCWEVQGIK